ncbi:tyrosinase [Mucidula mucida]|nr:tyrosinase [Mucidula mucida]
MSRFVITGASGGAPNRLEINDFVKNDKFFSLYIQALQVMSSNNQANIQSLFQLGGIHGLPYIPWDGATGGKAWDDSTQWGGYCTHGSCVLPEQQIMQQNAEAIAATYKVDQAAWKQAATDIRQPYWDWAANAIPPDQVIALKQVSITGPEGKMVTVDNPLYHYKFHPVDPSFPAPYSGWTTTLRQPGSTRPNATDDVARLRLVLGRAQSDITSSTYSMLTRVHNWTAFSNHTVGDGGSSSNSLEAIHDGIHVNVGGRGQMADPSVAAFDPIFFLHHANVDRMLSLWSALNPGVWVSRGDSQDGSFTMPPEAPVDENTTLTPFWNAQTTFWASAGTRDTAKLGYTYPEFNGLDMGNPAAVKTAIGAAVNRLYGSSIFGGFSRLSASASAGKEAEKPAAREITERAAAAPLTATNFLVQPASGNGHGHGDSQPTVHPGHPTPPEGDFWDWTARIEFKKYELGCSFSVLLFLGAVPEDPEDWLCSENLAGAHHAFVNSSAGRCANCRGQGDLLAEGFVHLDNAIAQHSGLGSLEPGVVEPYLTQALQWRVQKVDGTPADLESLEVSVVCTPLSYPPGSMFPVPGEPRSYNGITHGRPGGCRHA